MIFTTRVVQIILYISVFFSDFFESLNLKFFPIFFFMLHGARALYWRSLFRAPFPAAPVKTPLRRPKKPTRLSCKFWAWYRLVISKSPTRAYPLPHTLAHLHPFASMLSLVNPSHRPLWRISPWRAPLLSLSSKWAGPVGVSRFLVFSGFGNLLEYSSRVQAVFFVLARFSSVSGFCFLFYFSFLLFFRVSNLNRFLELNYFQIWIVFKFEQIPNLFFFFEIWTISKSNNFRFEHFRI
jgi:hypothetical protein